MLVGLPKRYLWLALVLTIGLVVYGFAVGGAHPSNTLYQDLIRIAFATELPPAGEKDFWHSADISKQACPLVDRQKLETMVREVDHEGGHAYRLVDPVSNTPMDAWSAWSNGNLLECFHHGLTLRAVFVTFKDGICTARASIPPSCDP